MVCAVQILWVLMLVGMANAATQPSADRIKDFIDSVQTKGAKINVDSLLKLNGAELNNYKKEARKRPLHIQVDTIIIDGEKEINEKGAWFSPGLNIIVLNYFVIDSAYRAYLQGNKDNRKLFEIRIKEVSNLELSNLELDRSFVHEYKHATDDRDFQALSLNPGQILQYSIHLEIAARIAELFYIRTRFLKYKELPLSPTKAELEKRKPSKWSNPFSEGFDYRGPKYNDLYCSYLFEHQNLSEMPDDYESLVILFTALSRMKYEFNEYKQQFTDDVKRGLKRDVIDKEFDEITKGKNSRLPSFDEQIQKMYIFKIDGKGFDLLAAVGSTGKLGLMEAMRSFVENEMISSEFDRILKEKSNLIDFRKKYGPIEDKISTWDVMLVPTANP